MGSGGNSIFRWSSWVSPELKAFQRQFPQKLSRAMGIVVNGVAFDMRLEMIESIGRLMTVRNKGFVKMNMVVEKARSGSSSPVAEVGSIRRGKFEGWAAQQFGEPVDRTRVPTLVARGGSERRVMRDIARLKRGRDIPTAREIVGRSNAGAVIAMMRILARKNDRRPFLIFPNEHPKFVGGLYEQFGRRDKRGKRAGIRLLQRLEADNAQPSRMDWLNPAWIAYQKKTSIANEWRKAWNLVGWRDVMSRSH